MKLLTPVDIPVPAWSIGPKDRLLLLGSCFSDNMAKRLQARFFTVTANPTGTLYNPVSIAHHSALFAEADVILLTFGTAWVYEDLLLQPSNNPLDNIVDNCQKRPAREFRRLRLSVDDIVNLWKPILQQYSDKCFVFTVSPIRHIKDGLHENTLSKAILLQAVEKLTLNHADRVFYFPAFEIMLDELRDYRFYAADMLHPTDTAADYIFERFADTFLNEAETRAFMDDMYALHQELQHRPLHPVSCEHQAFEAHLIEHAQQLTARYPWTADAVRQQLENRKLSLIAI